MQENKQILLIDYLDRSLEGEELAAVEQLLNSGDKESNEYWQSLQLAKEAIQYSGLYDQVASVREQYEQISVVRSMPTRQAVVRSFTQKVFRIAAVLVLLIGTGLVYKYVSTNSSSFYNDNYSSYDLSISRGANTVDEIERSYREGHWEAVISKASSAPVKSNKASFLTGMANMELKRYNEAANSFKQVITQNEQSGDDLFQDQAEYYLALSYMADNHTDMGIALLQQIRNNKEHLYHQKAAEMSWMDLKILEMKGK